MNETEKDAIAAQEKRNSEAAARRDPHASRAEVAGPDRVVQDDVNRYPGDHRNLPPGAQRPPVRGMVATDLDAQDYVTIWDHGPKSSDHPDKRTKEPEAHAADGLPVGDATPKETTPDEDWYKKNGDGPIALRMHASDANHAMAVEPARYTMEPLVGDHDVDAKMKDIQKARMEAVKRSAEQAALVQHAADHREAATKVIAERSAAAEVKKNEEAAKRNAPAKTSSAHKVDHTDHHAPKHHK